MAVTKVKPIKNTLSKALDYITEITFLYVSVTLVKPEKPLKVSEVEKFTNLSDGYTYRLHMKGLLSMNCHRERKHTT